MPSILSKENSRTTYFDWVTDIKIKIGAVSPKSGYFAIYNDIFNPTATSSAKVKIPHDPQNIEDLFDGHVIIGYKNPAISLFSSNTDQITLTPAERLMYNNACIINRSTDNIILAIIREHIDESCKRQIAQAKNSFEAWTLLFEYVNLVDGERAEELKAAWLKFHQGYDESNDSYLTRAKDMIAEMGIHNCIPKNMDQITTVKQGFTLPNQSFIVEIIQAGLDTSVSDIMKFFNEKYAAIRRSNAQRSENMTDTEIFDHFTHWDNEKRKKARQERATLNAPKTSTKISTANAAKSVKMKATANSASQESSFVGAFCEMCKGNTCGFAGMKQPCPKCVKCGFFGHKGGVDGEFCNEEKVKRSKARISKWENSTNKDAQIYSVPPSILDYNIQEIEEEEQQFYSSTTPSAISPIPPPTTKEVSKQETPTRSRAPSNRIKQLIVRYGMPHPLLTENPPPAPQSKFTFESETPSVIPVNSTSKIFSISNFNT